MTIARLSAGPGLSLAASLAALTVDPSVTAVVLAPPESRWPETRLLDLLDPRFGIGAVIPAVVGADGAVIDAGASDHGDRLVARPVVAGPGRGGALPAADVDGSRYPFAAASRLVAARAALAVEPTENSPAVLARALIDAARVSGQRVVFEPTWRVTAELLPAEEGEAPPVAASEGVGPILVVTGMVPRSGGPGNGPGDGIGGRLVSSLIDACPPGRISLLAVDGFGGEGDAEAWRSLGLDVTVGPVDLTSWFDQRMATFSHVVVAQSALGTSVRGHLQRTQPQAARILYFESLPFRAVDAWRAATAPDELPGLEESIADHMERSVAVAAWADSVWCERSDDASFLAGRGIGRAVVTVGPDLEGPGCEGGAPRPTVGRAERAGVVVVAGPGYDIGAADEEATRAALASLVPTLRRRDPDLPVKVIADRPTPGLRAAIAHADVELVAEAAAADVIGSARALLALHPFGTGGRAAVLQAVAAGTPFVATPQAVEGLALGGVATIAVYGFPADLGHAAWRLVVDDDHWAHVAAAVDDLRRTLYGRPGRAAAVRSALAALGVAPDRVAPDLASPDRASPDRAAGRFPGPAFSSISAGAAGHNGRPAGPTGPGRAPRLDLPLRLPGTRWPGQTPTPAPGPGDERERYRMWCDLYGPTPAVLDGLRAEIDRLPYQPTFSILMPVYNSDPDALRAALDSVRSQVYTNWQLCIADDGSTRPETLAILDELEGDPAISITRLGGNSGISVATNAALTLATGEFVSFLDHDDLYKPHALAQVVRWLNADPSLDMVYSDEDKIDESGLLIDPHIKPDWSPDHLMSNNYICHLTVLRREVVERIGGLRPEFDGSQDYDLVLRATEQTDRIAHIPEPLYTWRIIAGSAAGDASAKPYAWHAGRRALEEAIRRRGYEGEVSFTSNPGIYRSAYAIPGQPRVAIIIPTRDRVDLLRPCIDSVRQRSTYRNYELVVIDNESTDPATLGYLATMGGRVIRYPHRFNYARMVNLAAASVDCDVLLFLNNDTRVITPEWIEAMLEHAMRPEVGAVGARLHFDNGESQHEGIFVGMVGLAANAHYNGYWARGDYIRNTSAVTGACMMVRPTVYRLVGGSDERLRMGYNDVDLCLRIRQAGFEIVYTPYAQLHHRESATRTYDDPEDQRDGPFFAERWHPRESVDPYYSPLFERDMPFIIAL